MQFFPRADGNRERVDHEWIFNLVGMVPASRKDVILIENERRTQVRAGRNGERSMAFLRQGVRELRPLGCHHAEPQDRAVARNDQQCARIGYLLERTGHTPLTGELARFVDRHKPKIILLEPRSSEDVSDRDSRWRVAVNTTIEVEA